MEKPCILLLGLYSVLAHTAFEPEIRDLCHLCPHHGGHDVNISNPDRNLTFFNLHVANCMDLKRTVGFFYRGSRPCKLVQTLGPYCGCPIDTTQDRCQLCANGGEVGFPDRSLGGLLDPTDIFPFGAVNNYNVTCGLLQDVALNWNASDNVRLKQQRDFHSLCGCAGESPTVAVDVSPQENGTEIEPAKTFEPCSLCSNGEPVPYPDRRFHAGDIPVHTCGELQEFVAFFDVDETQCAEMSLYGHLCGCSPPPDNSGCHLCPNGEPIPKPHQHVHWFDSTINSIPGNFRQAANEMTCDLLEAVVLYEPSYLMETTDSDFVCLSVQLKSGYCGCSADWRQKFLLWAYRISGVLSLMVSSVHSPLFIIK